MTQNNKPRRSIYVGQSTCIVDLSSKVTEMQFNCLSMNNVDGTVPEKWDTIRTHVMDESRNWWGYPGR